MRSVASLKKSSMQALEFHFNPKKEENIVFDSFCYTPVNIEEKRLGNLYITSEITNAILPQTTQFLNALISKIKDSYYLSSNKSRTFPEGKVRDKSSEKALNRCLKKANEFLAQELHKENIGWLGNLNLAVLSISCTFHSGKVQDKSENVEDYAFNFTKIGDIKILLYRGGKLIDICSNLTINEIEPYPLKVFSNTLSGKLSENDLIFVLTQKVYESFLKENIFEKIRKLPQIDGKTIEKILRQNENLLSDVAGALLLINLAGGIAEKLSPFIIREKELAFLNKAFKYSGNVSKNIWGALLVIYQRVKTTLTKLKTPSLAKITHDRTPKISKISKIGLNLKFPEFSFPHFRAIFSNFVEKFSSQFVKKNLILVSILIFVLLLGFLIFQREAKENLKLAQKTILNIETKINQANNFLLLNNEKEANLILKDARQEILPLTKSGSPIIKDAKSLKEKIENSLNALNKLDKIENPQLFFEIQEKGFYPQNILYLNENVYIFSPASGNLFKLSKSGEINSIQLPQKFDLATVFDNSLLFFKNPNIITSFKKDEFGTPITLENYSSDLRFNGLFVFNSNLYFWDSKNCSKIIKYPHLSELKWASPENWFNEEYSSLFCPTTTSITIDGSVWISADGSEIKRFYSGSWQESLLINIFPSLEKPTKIYIRANLPYLYILEPIKNRILITTKSGDIIKQFQSEKFDNLKDFTVSQGGNTIWLLNGQKIYKVNL